MGSDPETPEGEHEPVEFDRHIVVRKRSTSHPKLVHPLSLRVEGARARHAGALEQSGQLLERALCLAPDNVSCLTSYGQTLAGRGRLEDALTCFQRAIAAEPGDTRPRHELGRALCQLGRHVEAVSCYQGILRIHPADVTARVGLGQALRGLGRLDDAAQTFRVATKQAPGDSNSWAELGRCWRDLGRMRKALNACKRATRLDARSAKAWRITGWTCLAMNMLDEAAEAFRAATKLNPEDANALAGLAAVRIRDGDVAGAEGILEPLVEAGRSTPRVAAGYADLRVRQGRADEAIPLLEDLVARPLAAGDRVRLAFGLGDLWEATGQSQQALSAWTQANALLDQVFDAAVHRSCVDGVISTWSKRLVHNLPLSSVGGRELVFIVGMPRAGINLVETILAAHPVVFPAGNNAELARLVERLPLQLGSPWPDCMERFQRIAPDPLSRKLMEVWNRASGHARRICISDPLNFRYLGLISFFYPEAKVIHVQRNPADTLLSCFSSPLLGREHSFASKLEDLAEYWRDYRRLMQHWRQVLNLPILEVHYEQLVREPEREIGRLGRFVGLRGMEVCQTFFNVPPRFGAPSPLEAPRPLDTRRIARSRAFETWLGPLRDLQN